MHTVPIMFPRLHKEAAGAEPVEAGVSYMPSILLTVFGGIVTATVAVYSGDDVVKIIVAIGAATVAVAGAIGVQTVRILKALADRQVETMKAMERKQAETIGAMKQKMAEAIKESPIATTPEEKAFERKAQALVTKEELAKPDKPSVQP